MKQFLKTMFLAFMAIFLLSAVAPVQANNNSSPQSTVFNDYGEYQYAIQFVSTQNSQSVFSKPPITSSSHQVLIHKQQIAQIEYIQLMSNGHTKEEVFISHYHPVSINLELKQGESPTLKQHKLRLTPKQHFWRGIYSSSYK